MPTPATFSLTATSQVMKSYQQSGTPPTITVNGNPFPQPKSGPPNFPTGVQLVVLDATGDLTNPSSIRFNQYLWVQNNDGSWMSTYGWMWQNVVRQILLAGDPQTQYVLLATFGLDANMAPSLPAIEMLLKLGAGKPLQTWETSVDVGSQSGYWVGFPSAYVFAGNVGYSYGEAAEQWSDPQSGSASATVEVTL